MYDEADIPSQVRAVIAETFSVDEQDLPADVSQETYGRWTSLYQTTLLFALEAHFQTAFTMEEMLRMTSLGAIVAVVEQHQPERIGRGV